MATTRPKRRRLAISLRLFLVLVLLAGSWMAWKANRTRAQRRAIRAIEQAGGEVFFDYQYRDGKVIPEGKPREPLWLRRWLGDEFFHDVVRVDFSMTGSRVNVAMSGVEQFDRLEELDFIGSKLDDTGLSHVKGLKALRVMELFMTDVTNVGLRHLRSLASVEELSIVPKRGELGRVYIEEDGLANLEGLKRLRKLNLFNTGITDRGVAHLKGLTRLEELNLSWTNISEVGLEHLTGLTNLRKLDLSGCRLTDRWMPILARLTELRELDLGVLNLAVFPESPPVTADGIKPLCKLRNLEVLTLPGDISPADLLALPKLKKVDLTLSFLSYEEAERLRAAHPSLIIVTRHLDPGRAAIDPRSVGALDAVDPAVVMDREPHGICPPAHK
jgi:hypothetical protein